MALGFIPRHVRPLACLLSTTALLAACATGSSSDEETGDSSASSSSDGGAGGSAPSSTSSAGGSASSSSSAGGAGGGAPSSTSSAGAGGGASSSSSGGGAGGSAPSCGNGSIDAGEDCDGALLGGKTCATILGDANATGALECSASCVFDPSGCSAGPICGDGFLQAGEECDDGNAVNNDRCSNACKTICKGSEIKWSVNGHCYIDADYTSYSDKTWDAAQAICAETPGGHLVTITSQAEYDFVYSTVMPDSWDAYSTSPRWIGLNDKAIEGAFVWVTGEPVLVTAWASGEPNNSGGNEHCAEMKWSDAAWNDLDCAKARPFVCEIEPTVLHP